MTEEYHEAGEVRLQYVFGNTSQIIEGQGLGVTMYIRGMTRDAPNVVSAFNNVDKTNSSLTRFKKTRNLPPPLSLTTKNPVRIT